MEYKEKMMSGADILVKLPTPPRESYFNEHYFCDYIEILALAANADVVSLADVIERFDIDSAGSDENSAIQDKWESRLAGWFAVLEVRRDEYAGFYPFEIESSCIRLKEELNNQHYLYLLLLLSSNLAYINSSFRAVLTTDFESVSLAALTKYLPQQAEVHKFGKSGVANNKFKGAIKVKIDLLAEDLKLDVCYKSHFFSANNNGDYGLDVVAWLPFCSDSNKLYIPIFLAQCATGKNWLEKQHEPLKIQNSISGLDHAINTLFIPYDARNIDRTYNEEAEIKTHLIFDRFRLIFLLKDDFSFIDDFDSLSDVVLKAIEFEEDIV